MLNNALVIGIILLFIGISIAPSINADIYNKPNINTNIFKNQGEKLKINCKYFTLSGIEEIENRISIKDYERLSQLIDSSDTDAISYELNELGLLPETMNIKQANLILSGEYFTNYFEKYLGKIGKNFVYEETNWKRNFLCSIQGDAPDNYFIPSRRIIPSIGITLFSIPLFILVTILYSVYPPENWPYLLFNIIFLTMGLFYTVDLYSRIFPWKIGGYVYAILDDAFKVGHPNLNTSSILGRWSLNNRKIEMNLFGFIGLWVTIDDNQQTPGCEFIGNCLFIKAKGIDYD